MDLHMLIVKDEYHKYTHIIYHSAQLIPSYQLELFIQMQAGIAKYSDLLLKN